MFLITTDAAMEQMGAVPLMCVDDVQPGDILIKRKRFYAGADRFGVSRVAYLALSDVQLKECETCASYYVYDALKLTGDKVVPTTCQFSGFNLRHDIQAERPPGLQSGGEIRIWHVKRDRCSP